VREWEKEIYRQRPGAVDLGLICWLRVYLSISFQNRDIALRHVDGIEWIGKE